MQSDDKDSLTRLLEDVEVAASDNACRYFNEQVTPCARCPARDDPRPCLMCALDDIASRLHALMPHDAKGVEIKPGDTIESPAKEQNRITDILLVPAIVEKDGTDVTTFALPHRYLWRVVQPDSWERLEQDAAKRVCEYAGAQRSIADAHKYSCINCPYDVPGPHTDRGCHERMRLDLVRRAKRLAGVEQ